MKKPKRRRPSRSKYPNALPKGAYRLPTSGYVTRTSSVFASQRGPRRITVIGIRREHPDLKRLAQAMVEMAKQQIEREEQERQKR